MEFLEVEEYLVLECPALRDPEPTRHREVWERRERRAPLEPLEPQAFREQPCRGSLP